MMNFTYTKLTRWIMKRINSWLNEGFVFTWAFSILSMCLYVSRLPPHVLSNCHEIWNYHTWYKGRATYMSGYFISLLFKNSGCFVGLLCSYRQTPWPIHKKFGFSRYFYWPSILFWLECSAFWLSVQRLRPHHSTDCLEIWNHCRPTWYKGGAKYM